MNENTNKKFGKVKGAATIIRADGTREEVELHADKVTKEQFEEAVEALGLVKSEDVKVTQ